VKRRSDAQSPTPGFVQSAPEDVVRGRGAQAAAGDGHGRGQVVRRQQAEHAAQQLRGHRMEGAPHQAARLGGCALLRRQPLALGWALTVGLCGDAIKNTLPRLQT